MNKGEFIRAIATDSGLTLTDVGKFLGAFETITAEALSRGERVILAGFGSFEKVSRNARTGRNFTTGTEIHVSSYNAVKFSAGKNLKEIVNE